MNINQTGDVYSAGRPPRGAVFAGLICLGLLSVVAFNIGLIVHRMNHGPFTYDEFYHAHVAWNVMKGKIIYRDFFEHHGPVPALLNGLVWKMGGFKPGFSTLFALRLLNLFPLALILLMTFLLARKACRSVAAALAAPAVLSGLVFFQIKVSEIRPDALGAMLVVLSVYLLVRGMEGRGRAWAFLSGACFALASQCSSKALPGGLGVVVFFLFSLISGRNCRRLLWGRFLGWTLGAIVVVGIFGVYFATNRALGPYLRCVYAFNYACIFQAGRKWNFTDYGAYFLSAQQLFVLLSLPGLLLMLLQARRGQGEGGKLTETLLFITTVSTSAYALAGGFSQDYLFFLPFLSVAAAHTVRWLARAAASRPPLVRSAGAAGLALAYLICAEYTAYNNVLGAGQRGYVAWEPGARLARTRREVRSFLRQQEALTEKILRVTRRDEPVAYFWNPYGGYVFNEDVDYLWCLPPNWVVPYRRLWGREAYGEEFVEKLRAKNVRFIIAAESELKRLPAASRRYIEENYAPCRRNLWQRKPPENAPDH